MHCVSVHMTYSYLAFMFSAVLVLMAGAFFSGLPVPCFTCCITTTHVRRHRYTSAYAVVLRSELPDTPSATLTNTHACKPAEYAANTYGTNRMRTSRAQCVHNTKKLSHTQEHTTCFTITIACYMYKCMSFCCQWSTHTVLSVWKRICIKQMKSMKSNEIPYEIRCKTNEILKSFVY